MGDSEFAGLDHDGTFADSPVLYVMPTDGVGPGVHKCGPSRKDSEI